MHLDLLFNNLESLEALVICLIRRTEVLYPVNRINGAYPVQRAVSEFLHETGARVDLKNVSKVTKSVIFKQAAVGD